MDIILNFTFVILIIISSFLLSYTMNIQATTMWFSKNFFSLLSVVSPFDCNQKQLQSIVTPKSQNVRHFLIPIVLIILIINCYFLHWYYFLIAFLSAYILTIFIKILIYNKSLSHYISIVKNDLIEKKSKLKNRKDFESIKFLDHIIIALDRAYLEAKENSIDINKL